MSTYKGIDIAHHQGNPNFARVKAAGIDYVMIKATEGVNYVDPCFTTNAKAAIAAGLPIGVYHFLRAGSVANQVRDCLAAIKPYKITWPVAVDVENPPKGTELSDLGRDKLTDMVLDFCARIRADGYQPMVYSNRNWLYIAKLLDIDRIKAAGIPIWLAWYSKATPDNTNRSALCDMWQYASDGKVDGITSNGLDMDISYKDFAPKTTVSIDTTMDVIKPQGDCYTFKTTSTQIPAATVGTDAVVKLVHCRREMEFDYWHLFFIGESGQAAGIYTAAPGEQPLKRFVARIK